MIRPAHYILFFIVSLFFLIGCESDTEKARDYYRDVFERTDSLLYDLHHFEDAVTGRNDQDPMNSFSSLNKRLDEAWGAVDKAGPFQSDDTLRQTALRLLLYYRAHCEGDFNEMAKQRFENRTEEDQEQIYIGWDEFYKNEWPLYQQFDQAGLNFSNRYNIYELKTIQH